MNVEQQFVIVAGKGGVGRTTVTAALGTALARRGKRTLLAHVRCRQQLGRLLGVHEVGEEITPVAPNLWAVNINPRAALREVGMMVLRFRSVYRAVFENRLVRYLLRAMPALEEYSMLGKAWYHTTETVDGAPRFDHVVFDGPATGHLISMLRIPRVIVDTVPGGPLTADARRVHEMLTNPARTAMWIVTLAEEMPVAEAVDLYNAATDELGIAATRLVVNMLYPDPVGADVRLAQALQRVTERSLPSLEPLVAAAQTLHRRAEVNGIYLQQLHRHIPLDRVELPHLFEPRVDSRALAVLSDRLELALR